MRERGVAAAPHNVFNVFSCCIHSCNACSWRRRMPDAELSIGERMARLGEGSSRREGSPGRTESSDAEGYQMVELVRPTPDTKLGLTFGEFRGSHHDLAWVRNWRPPEHGVDR